MNYNIDYNICSCIILIIILISFHVKNKIPIFQNKIFISMVWITLISIFFDILCVIGESYNSIFSRNYIILTNCIYFLLRNMIPFLYVCYIIALSEIIQSMKIWTKIIVLTPILFSVILIILNPVCHWIFYINRANQYERRMGMIILYSIAAYYLLFGIIYVTIFRKAISLQERFALYSFVFLAILSIIIQIFFPTFLLEAFGISICLWLIYLTIQKPEELIDRNTGLMNKYAFFKTISLNLKKKEKFCLIFILIEDFPFLNNTFGVYCINELIKKVAIYLNKFTKIGTVYHLNENYFCLAFRYVDLEAAQKIMLTIRERFKYAWNDKEFKIKLFARFCFISYPRDVSSLEEILDIIELFKKEETRTQSRVIFAENLDLNYRKRSMEIEQAIKRAISEKTLEVYYQPIFSIENQKIISAEALVRLKDEKLGFISPEEFIPIAEKTGHILKIGKFVFESVCAFIAENHLKEKGIEFIEINLSVVECVQDKIVNQIEEILKKYNVDIKQINLEITETATATSSEMLEINMRDMSKKGISFSLDDYGTGYSNMNYIIELPFRLVKIDKSIVWASFENKRAEIAISSLISMLKKLDMKIVAEGVETKEQANKLTEMGCDYLQGYYYSRPVPQDQFLQIL